MSLQRALAAHGGALRGPLEPQGLVYKPALLAQASLRYSSRRYALDYTRQVACLVPDPRGGTSQAWVDWDAFALPPFDPPPDAAPAAGARFSELPESLATRRGVSALQHDFLEWVYQSGPITVRVNEALKVYAGPGSSGEEFRRQVEESARAGLQAEIDKIAAGFDERLEALSRKIERQQRFVDRRQDAMDQRKAEQNATNLEFIASVFTRRKRSLNTSLAKQRMARQARGEFDESRKVLEALREEWQALAGEREEALERAQADWRARAGQVTQAAVRPLKKDIAVTHFGVAWLPYHQIKSPDGMIELAAF